MKDKLNPSKDLKFSARFLGRISKNMFQETKPLTTMILSDMVLNIHEKLSKKK